MSLRGDGTGVVTAINARAVRLTIHCARVHSVRLANLVGLPHVELCAARAIFAQSCIGIGLLWGPFPNVRDAIDPFQVMGALGITVTGSIPSSGVILWVFAFASIGVHLNKVQS